MNITTVYFSKGQWFNIFGLFKNQQLLFLIMCPINLIGATLNLLTFVILTKNEFRRMLVYKYLRIYTLNSAVICLLDSTQFIGNSQQFFQFSNSYWSIRYFSNFYIPLITTLTFYQSSLDIILSFDRIVLFSNRFSFYKSINPLLVSSIAFILSCILLGYYWLLLTHVQVDLPLNKTKTFRFHYFDLSYISNKYPVYVINFISDGMTLIIELFLSVSTIILLKNYLRSREITGNFTAQTNTTIINIPHPSTARARKMEVKVTILVSILSFFSIM
jgi:hypothetical protein